MKKLSHFCMITLLLCVSFLVVNLNMTKETIRVREMDRTVHSFDFYLKEVKVSSGEMLAFFETLVDKYEVSVVKTDINETVLKSGVFTPKTFPYQQFGLTSLAFPENGQGTYTNQETSDKLGDIPVFLDAKNIKLMTMKAYFRDGSRTVNGHYRVTTTYAVDKAAILNDISAYFGIDLPTLTTPSYQSAVEWVNRDLVLMLLSLVMALLLLILTSVYQPILELKKIGVEKLLGYKTSSILVRLMKENLLILGGGSLLVTISCLVFLEDLPSDFLGMLLLSHFFMIQLYFLIQLVVYVLIQKITVSAMIKGFSGFRIGLALNVVLKGVMVAGLTVLLVGVGNALFEANRELHYQEQWEKQGDYLTLESVTSSDTLWQEFLSNSDAFHDYYSQFYRQLRRNLPTYYVRSSPLLPTGSQDEVISEFKVLYANRDYLATKQFVDLPVQTDGKKQVLFPEKMKEDEAAVENLAQMIVFRSLKTDEQKKTKPSDLSVQVVYYTGDWSFFPYNDQFSDYLDNPIISLVEDEQMLWEEKAYLSSTGVNNPIKIVNTSQNLQKIKRVVRELPDTTSLTFSSLKSIQQGKIDTYRDAVRNFNGLCLIIGILSLVVSYFLVASLFIWKKTDIITKKFLGWSLWDRYRFVILMNGMIYSLPVPILLVAGKSFLPLLVFLGFVFVDFIAILFWSRRMEGKHLAQQLKGDTL